MTLIRSNRIQRWAGMQGLTCNAHSVSMSGINNTEVKARCQSHLKGEGLDSYHKVECLESYNKGEGLESYHRDEGLDSYHKDGVES